MKNEEKTCPTGYTLKEIESKLAGLHFAKESLTKGEREILVLAEGLLWFCRELEKN